MRSPIAGYLYYAADAMMLILHVIVEYQEYRLLHWHTSSSLNLFKRLS